MRLTPVSEETIVSVHHAEEIIMRIRRHTRIYNQPDRPPLHIFNGHFEEDSFRISLNISYPQNTLPLTLGRIEKTSKGSIIFLQYSLFPAARVILWVAMGILLVICAIFLVIYAKTQETKYLLASLIAVFTGVFYYLTLMIGFHRKVKLTHITLEKVLTYPGLFA